MLKALLQIISPAQLKKYGMYAVLSFFIMVSVLLVRDDLNVRNSDVTYERAKNDSLQHMLKEQYTLKLEQQKLLEKTSNEILRVDTIHTHERN